jgi:carboxyl-terminal processing protease
MDNLIARRNRFMAFYAALFAFAAGVLVDRTGLLPGAPPVPEATIRPFWEAWRLVDEHYVDRGAVKPQVMTHGAIRGMLAALGDIGHTTFLAPEDFIRLERDLKGQLYGIGARLTVRKGELIIVYTFPDSPARKAGILPGDRIMAVDKHEVRGLPMEKVIEMVRGKPGSVVELRVLRKGRPRPLDVSVPRGEVAIPAVSWQVLPGVPIAHVAIQEFGTGADEQLRKALTETRRQGVKGLLIDVRGDPGGLKDQAVAVASEFLAKGTVFIEKDARDQRTPVPVKEGGHALDVPLCVLIDEGSASASEIFSGAIQDHQRGKLIGTRTFGTGTVLQPFRLSDASVVLLATAEWLTPNGRAIWHHGITPDIEVTLPEGVSIVLPEMERNWTVEDLAKTEDPQLRKGLEVLKEQLKR